MQPIDFYEVDDFREAEINGTPALFTEYRIDRNTLPQGVYCYEIRASDSGRSDFSTIENHVRVNFTGSVITHRPVPMHGGDFSEIYRYGLFDEMSYDEWLTRTEE